MNGRFAHPYPIIKDRTIGSFRYWKSVFEQTTGWYISIHIWRVALIWKLLRHQYASSPDRWVLQTSHHYDRKARA